MITLQTTLADRRRAKAEGKAMGVLKNSFTDGMGNARGMLGEIVVHNRHGGKRVGKTSRNFDIILPNGLTVDVKTTQSKLEPKPYYTARVYGAEDHQEWLRSKCNVYYFIRSNVGMTEVTLLGWLSAQMFFDLAEFRFAGDHSPSDRRTVMADEYAVEISRLNCPLVPITRYNLGLYGAM